MLWADRDSEKVQAVRSRQCPSEIRQLAADEMVIVRRRLEGHLGSLQRPGQTEHGWRLSPGHCGLEWTLMNTTMIWIRWFDDMGMADVATVGGKNASLGEMRRALTPLGIRIPDGFATTADAYRDFMHAADLERVIRGSLADIDIGDIDALQAAGARLRSAILAAPLPPALIQAIRDGYQRLEQQYGVNCDVAGTQQRHSRGSPRGELRRPAGDISQHPWQGDADRRGQALLRVALHRPGNRLQSASRLRPPPGGAVGRRTEDGQVRSRECGRDVLHRHGDRILQRRPDHRRVRAW